jgi:cysteine-rich repeat protein
MGKPRFDVRRTDAMTAFFIAAVIAITLAPSMLPGLAPPAQAQLNPGDILVADFEGGENGAGLLFRVNPATGARTVLSDFGNPAQGPTGQSPFGVAVVDTNTILVIDGQGVGGTGTLFLVNATTGARTILSDFGNAAQGPLGVDPVGIALGAGGILITDINGGTNNQGALFRVHPLTGARTVLSDFGNAAQGPLGQTPTGVTRGANGIILVIDPDGGTDVPNDGKTGGNGALFVVDPITGGRTMLSDFGNAAQGPTGSKPGGVALGPGGAILIADTDAGTGANGVVFSVDPITGMRTVLSNFGNAAQGPTGIDPFFLAVSATGHILVTDDTGGTDLALDGHTGGNGALFRVDPTNGTRTLLSDFGNVTQGPTGVDPVGVAIVPLIREGDALVIDLLAGTNGVGALFSVDPVTGLRTLLSDFGNPQQGPLGFDPVDVTLGPHGDILVVDEDRGGGLTPGALFRVNPVNGSRTLLSDFTNATQGPTGGTPHGVVLGPDGDILVVTANGGTANRGALFRVDPVTGARTQVSDFGNPMQGPLGSQPEAVAVLGPGEALVLDTDAQPPGGGIARGLLFRVSLATGVRTILSNFSESAQGPLGVDPWDVDVEPSGSLVVIESLGTTGNLGVLLRVDPVTGARTVISDFANATRGPTGRHPLGVAVEPSGTILVIDNVAGMGNRGTLFRVDPASGTRTVVSDFSLPGQGPLGGVPLGVTMLPRNALLSFCGDGVQDAGEQCDDGNAVSGDGCSATCTLEGAAGINDYLCYGTKPEKGSLSVFEVARGVTLVDRVETLTVNVKGTENLCNPADVDGGGIADPSAHLRTYTIAQAPLSPRFQERVGLGVVTQFGALTLDLIRRDDLMVPTVKSLTGPVGAPGPGAGDRYKCYGVNVIVGLKNRDVVAADQFGPARTYKLGRPTRLCVPVSKNGEAIKVPDVDLMCFGARRARGEARHVPVIGINTRDEFWAERLRSTKETELCVPAETTGLP